MAADYGLDGRAEDQANTRMRFLIIDDSITMRRIIANILVRLGFPDAVHASNGREALDRLATEQVDVVITDWYMPEMNGLDFVKSLRNTPATSHIPIVIVTANAASDDIQHALELGVNSYILKPFTVETMRDKIGALCEQEGFAPPTDPHKAQGSAPLPAAAEPPAVEQAVPVAVAAPPEVEEAVPVAAAPPPPSAGSAADAIDADEDEDADLVTDAELQAQPQEEAAAVS
jgi:two-component system chemotaxis response regulator CheY